ncbi:MAG TPA: hypothetical protein VJN88_13970 [Ktedonobacterales bacterium]|nr:hypothetical protein [Ktedonobacterales bacterium]
MPSTTLDHPDPLWEYSDPDRSPSVADALTLSYGHLKRGEYALASRAIGPTQFLSMSRRQELRVFYMQAATSLRLGNFKRGLALLDEASAQALREGDHGALAQFAYMLADVSRELDSRDAAAVYCELALDAWNAHTQNQPADSSDGIFRLDVLISLALAHFYYGRFDPAERTLRAAKRLAGRIATPPVRRANLAWIEAMFQRWRGDAGGALTTAFQAYATLDLYGTRLECARLRTLMADIAMDLAVAGERSGLDATSQHFLGIADSQITPAFAYLEGAGDPLALGVTTLAQVRFARMARYDSPRLDDITRVERTAREYGDLTLLGQVWTARGDEHRARGERGSATNAYEQSLHTLKSAEMGALGVWARRALHEMRRN